MGWWGRGAKGLALFATGYRLDADCCGIPGCVTPTHPSAADVRPLASL